ncbi:MAG: signal peptidase I [Coriobacteriia bacterium]
MGGRATPTAAVSPADCPYDPGGAVEERTGRLPGCLETFLWTSLAFLCVLAVKTFLIQPFLIPTESMAPTLEPGDRVLVNKVSYSLGEPHSGDVVVLASPDEEGVSLIKRVIAVAGQTVDIRDGQVFVDGEALYEPYVRQASRDDLSLVRPVRVPEGHVFVLGDNRADSVDSRHFGPQPIEAVRGQALAVYWPPTHLGRL